MTVNLAYWVYLVQYQQHYLGEPSLVHCQCLKVPLSHGLQIWFAV
jgi:hypothetical protein